MFFLDFKGFQWVQDHLGKPLATPCGPPRWLLGTLGPRGGVPGGPVGTFGDLPNVLGDPPGDPWGPPGDLLEAPRNRAFWERPSGEVLGGLRGSKLTEGSDETLVFKRAEAFAADPGRLRRRYPGPPPLST